MIWRAFVALFVIYAPLVAVGGQPRDETLLPQASVSDQVWAEVNAASSSEMVTVIVTLRDQPDLVQLAERRSQAQAAGVDQANFQEMVIRTLQEQAQVAQAPIVAYLDERRAAGEVNQVTAFWSFDGLSVTAGPDVVRALAARADVATISADDVAIVPLDQPAAVSPANNLAVINVPALWDLGYTGQGIVVANMDSGVDVSHPDLQSRWRGGANSWFDPYNQHPVTPFDSSGHGTWTMGVMVSGDASGVALGIAPDAKWIAVKMFNDEGTSTATAIHAGYQWLLDPDGNPATADAPQVVNNSWAFGSPGCNLEFQRDLEALEVVGILPVFAAGNYGPNAATSVSPANNSAALAVGAVNNGDQSYALSSRGPSACDDGRVAYPDLVAPGVSILTPAPGGQYHASTGTSLAAPHVAGSLALLLGAFPWLTPGQQKAALLTTTVDLGAPGPDTTFGHGRLDVLAAYTYLKQGLTAAGATITVDTTDDVLADDGLCSLREAIIAANIDAAYGNCVAGRGNDTIRLSAGLPSPATFVLNKVGAGEDNSLAGDLDIKGKLTIVGAGVGKTIVDGNAKDRVFEILGDAQATLSGMTIRNGKTAATLGGGANVHGGLTLKDVTLTGNNGGGIRSDTGSLTLDDTYVTNNTNGYGIFSTQQATLIMQGGAVSGNQQGGVYSNASTASLNGVDIADNGGNGVVNEGPTTAILIMNDCIVRGNTGLDGGGVVNHGAAAQATIDGTHIHDNTATGSGGGIFSDGTLSLSAVTVDHNQAGQGGGIANAGGEAVLLNSTISSNHATGRGGGLDNVASATISNTTVYLNQADGGGGNLASAGGDLTIGNSIMAKAKAGGNCKFDAANVVSQDYNLTDGATCGLGGTHDMSGTDPKLMPLAFNGGPTPTHALDVDSPAFDRIPSGGNGCLATGAGDQRGVGRPQGGACDVGAYEAIVLSVTPTPIYAIQGVGAVSPQVGQTVTVRGIVTAVRPEGFYLQDVNSDSDDTTSEALFIVTASPPGVNVGDDLVVGGRIAEETMGSGASALTTTALTNPTITLLTVRNPLPTPIVIGQTGRMPPTAGVVGLAASTSDFYESLEAMRVELDDAVVVGPTAGDGAIWVVNDTGAGPRTERGGIYVTSSDNNPERIRLDATLYPANDWPQVDVGSRLVTPVVGVFDDRAGRYALLPTATLTVDASQAVTHEVTTLNGDAEHTTVATLSAGDLPGNAAESVFAAQAALIVTALHSPDIVVLTDVLDDNGIVDDGVTSGAQTFTRLISAIAAAGGPTYAVAQSDPENDADGGPAGGNRRTGFLYNADRVEFTSVPGNATTATGVSCAAGAAALTLNPGRIDPTDVVFAGSAKPIAGQFVAGGVPMFVIGADLDAASNALTVAVGSDRVAQAQVINNFVQQILTCAPSARIIVAADLGVYPYSEPLTALMGDELTNLMDQVPAADRYTFIVDGNSVERDPLLVSAGLAATPVDVVHTNAEFATRLSDHDPKVARIDTPTPPIAQRLVLPLVRR